MVIQDTAGQEDLDHLRSPFYRDTDVVVFCFALDNPDSLDNVQSVWVPEVRRYCGRVPFLLAANKADLALNAAGRSGFDGCPDGLDHGHFNVVVSDNPQLNVIEDTGRIADVNQNESAYALSSDSTTHQEDSSGSNQVNFLCSQEYATSAGKVISSSQAVMNCTKRNRGDRSDNNRDAYLRSATQQETIQRDCKAYGRFHGASLVEKGRDLATRLGSNGFFLNSAVLDVGVSQVFEAALAAAVSSKLWMKKNPKQT